MEWTFGTADGDHHHEQPSADSMETTVTSSFKALGIDQLSRDERLALVQEIWDSIATDSTDHLLQHSQRQELRSRIAEDDATPDDVIPWDDVKARTKHRLQNP